MLTISQINEYFSEDIVSSHPRAVLVEYLQYELLDSLFKLPEAEALSFIGGTANRIIYQSNRFSEDLDFDNFSLSDKEFEDLLERVLKEMRLKGFLVESRYVDKGAWHCYIRFPELLFKYGITTNDKEKILIRLDSQRKSKLYATEYPVLNKFGIFRKIQAAPKSVLLSNKLVTILQRKREKGRDLYDVSYLYGMTKPLEEYISQYLNISFEDFWKKLMERIDELDLSQLAKDVEPFLINPDEIDRVLLFREFVRSL